MGSGKPVVHRFLNFHPIAKVAEARSTLGLSKKAGSSRRGIAMTKPTIWLAALGVTLAKATVTGLYGR
jgi:hypothetical protein